MQLASVLACLEIIDGFYQLFMPWEDKSAGIKNIYMLSVNACVEWINRFQVNQSCREFVTEMLSCSETDTLVLFEWKTVIAVLAGLEDPGCRCNSVSELVAEKGLAHFKANCSSCRSPSCRVTPGPSRSLVQQHTVDRRCTKVISVRFCTNYQ